MFTENNKSVSVRIALVLILIAGVFGVTLAKADTVVRYVKWDAAGANNGSSWTDAYTDLQSALSAASSGDEIWVAAGMYRPTSGADRTVSFVLKNGVAVYGGFSGNETSRDQRNPATNITILSGDIGIVGDNSDNSYHVVVGSNTDNSAVLDGFTITAGNANDGLGLSEFNKGGGMYNHNGSPTLTKLVFTANYGVFGGGMCNSGTVTEVWTGSNPALTDVIFVNNSAMEGGGMRNQYYSSPTLTNVTFEDNTAIRSGGGLENFDYSSPELKNVTFDNNVTEGGGGGIMNWNGSNPHLINVTFHGNVAVSDAVGVGGGVANFLSSPNMVNTTFTDNSADHGGGIYNDYGGNVTVHNSILWGNSSDEIYSVSGTVTVSYSIVQGGYPGTSNLDVDPLLGPLQNNGGFTQTMALLPGSPAIDAGDDANCPTTDQRGVTRPQGNHCDMGAYEYEVEAPPNAFNKSSPVDGATNQPINLTLTWGASSGATSYEYCVDTTINKSCDGSWISNGTSTSVLLSGLMPGTPHEWHVRALGSAGTTYSNGSATAFWSFTTGSAPVTFNKISPGDGAINQPLNVTIKWGVSSGATSYEYCVDTTVNDSCNDSWISNGTSISKLISELTPSTVYEWHVRAINAFGITYSNGTSAEFWSFTTQPPATPGIPVLLSPASGALVSTLQPKLDWKDSAPPAYYYQLQVSTNNTFTALVLDETPISTSEFTLDFGLDPGIRYYWRVRAFNVNDVASGWSTVWNFRTPLAAPILTSPPNNVPPVQLDNDRPAFDWEDVDGATQYTIQVATSNTFGTLLVNATINASEYNTISDLPQNKTLFWRVRAKNSIVTGPWSAVGLFQTGNPPSVPVLLSPANNSAIKGYTPTLKWKASAIPPGTELDYYKIQIATDAAFLDLIADEDVIVNQFTPPDELLPGLTYYWRVRAFNKDGEYSAWSTRWSFKTRLNVFDNGVWWIKKLPPSFPDDANQYPMDVYVNGVYWGKTHRLDFGHRRSGSDYPTAAVIYNTGYVRLTPLGLPFGTSFILGPAHWDSDNRYFHNLQISRIDINTASAAPSGPLKIKVTARDYNEDLWPLYHFDVTHQITFPDPTALKAAMTVTQTYTAAADFDLSAARQAIHEGFKLAQFSSMYIDDTYRDSDGAQYTDTNKDEYAAWFKDLLCDGLVFDAPLPLDNRNPWVQSFHGDNAGWQGNTPNTIIRLANPNLAGEVVPQGYWTCSSDENDDNVGLWLNHESAPTSFSAGQSQSVGYLLISQDEPLPSAPGLVAPDNGISLTTNRPTFEWKDVAWETKYNLQISTAGNFSTLARNLTVTSSPFTLPTDLPRKTKLYWRVRTVGAGGTTDWSEVWSFTTGNPPSVPALVSPANNAQLATNTPTLDWYNSTNPTGTTFKYYEVEVDNDNDFSSPEFSAATTEGSIAHSKITTSVLAPGAQYYWRVRAVNLVGGVPHYSGWSVVRSFRTP